MVNERVGDSKEDRPRDDRGLVIIVDHEDVSAASISNALRQEGYGVARLPTTEGAFVEIVATVLVEATIQRLEIVALVVAEATILSI